MVKVFVDQFAPSYGLVEVLRPYLDDLGAVGGLSDTTTGEDIPRSEVLWNSRVLVWHNLPETWIGLFGDTPV